MPRYMVTDKLLKQTREVEGRDEAQAMTRYINEFVRFQGVEQRLDVAVRGTDGGTVAASFEMDQEHDLEESDVQWQRVYRSEFLTATEIKEEVKEEAPAGYLANHWTRWDMDEFVVSGSELVVAVTLLAQRPGSRFIVDSGTGRLYVPPADADWIRSSIQFVKGAGKP
jgi:hypothetical protein